MTCHKWVYADFETTGLRFFEKHGYTKVWLWGIMTPKGQFKHGETIATFWETLQLTDENIIVYFHNLAFDFTFLEYFFTTNRITYEKRTTSLGRILFAEVVINKKHLVRKKLREKTIRIQFRDSLLLLPGSLEDLAISFNLPLKISKSKEFYDRLRYTITNAELEYLHRDCAILKELLNTLFLKYLIFENPPLTTASLARNQLYARCLAEREHDAIFACSEQIDTELRRYYYGGYCYLNPAYQGKIITDVSGIDVNSFYPSIMASSDVIFGEPKKYAKYVANPLYTFFYIIKINASLKHDKHPYLLNKGFLGKNNYVKDTDGCELFGLWDFELSIVKQRYTVATFEVIASYQFSKLKTNPFTEFLQKLYHNKQMAKGSEKQLNKIIINSLYGKYGQRQKSTTKIYTDFFSPPTRVEEFTANSYLPYAMYITAKARFILNKTIELFGPNFVYSDTDSIYFVGNLPKDGIIINKDMGAWDLEHDKEPAVFLGQKLYKIGKTNKVVGLNKKAQKNLDFSDFLYDKTFVQVNLKQKKVLGGCILIPFDYQIKKRD